MRTPVMSPRMSRFGINFVLLLLFLAGVSGTAPVFGEEYPGRELPTVPPWLTEDSAELADRLSARSAVLLEAEAGTLLFAKAPDLLIPPASLTKLMTVHLALVSAEAGRFPLEERVAVPEVAWASNQAPGSSLMFLGPGQVVSGEELLYGLGVSSGNDAAVAVAVLVAGSVEAFVAEMNAEARRLGYESFRFNDPAGLSADNRSSARELADFAAYLIERHPGILDYFAVPSFTYPKPDNFVNGHREGSITQWNRNSLLRSYDGADGFKTGFIEASQYNLVATAERHGRRLIAVLLGVPGASHAVGGARRAEEATLLLDHGYREFELVTLRPPELPPLRVYGGVDEAVSLEAEPLPPVSLPRGSGGRVSGRYTLSEHLWAPVLPGRGVGEVRYTLDGVRLATGRVTTSREVAEDRFLGRIYDSLLFLTAPLVEPR